MKITETTPKVERTFTLELTEIELRTLEVALGLTSHESRARIATQERTTVLSSGESTHFYYALRGVLNANDN